MRKGKSNLFVAAVAAACTASACASDFEDYFLDGSFSLPPVGSGSFLVAFDPLSDGRLLAVTGNEVYLQQSVGSSDFDVVAEFDASQSGGSSDPAFVHLSPDGSQVAAGLGFGKPVAVFNVADLGAPGSPTTLTSTTAGGTTKYFSVDHWEAAWFDEQYLALTAGSFSQPSMVTLLDVSSDVASPFNPVVINNICGSSSGVAFDAQEGLYTGNGFDSQDPPGPSVTGTIRRFAFSEWHDVLSGGTPADFEFDGQFVADLLSAASLGFDAEGNFFAGGGDLFGGGQIDFFALVGSVALADALAGLDPITLGDPTEIRQFDPDPNPYSFYSVCYNPAVSEIYAASGATVYRYAVPEPATGVMVVLLLQTLLRRRR
jgi:hypothetical protein